MGPRHAPKEDVPHHISAIEQDAAGPSTSQSRQQISVVRKTLGLCAFAQKRVARIDHGLLDKNVQRDA